MSIGAALRRVAATTALALAGATIAPLSTASAQTSDPEPAAAPSAAAAPVPQEIVSMRSRDAKHFQNADGTITAVVGPNLHYEASPGRWEDTDLNFGSNGAVERNDVRVGVVDRGVEATERASGKGVRWRTPARPATNGRRAAFSDQGLEWSYLAAPSGIKLGAVVERQRGARTYEFSFDLLGGAAGLTVATDGELRSDAFVVPRAFALGSDGTVYPAGVWRVTGDNRVAFDFDDRALPRAAYPYLLDPTTTFTVGVGSDDGRVQASGAAYPPPAAGADTTSPGNTPRRGGRART